MGRSWELKELTRIRVLLFLREPEAVFWVFVFPVILAAVLGYAFRYEGVDATPIGVVEAPGIESLLQAFEQDDKLEVARFDDVEHARRSLQKAIVDALVFPGERPRIELDENRAEAEVARLRVMRALELQASGGVEAEVELRVVEDRGWRYIDFLFPGLLGMNFMGTGMWGVGFAIADVRRRKLLKRLLVTPMRRSSFFLSFMFSRLVFLALEVLVLVLIGGQLLGVPFRCGVLDFGVVSLLGALTFACMGILVASRARSMEAVSGLMNFVMMPMWLTSGVFFSYERFPEVLHPVLSILPLTALNDALRKLMLDGEGAGAVLPELGILLFWCVATFALALKIFRWR